LLTLCTRFVHALLTLAEFFLNPLGSFWVLIYEVPFGSIRGSAHGLLTVCSRCSRSAHVLLTLWGLMCLSRWRNP
jgi:hypothetical protein